MQSGLGIDEFFIRADIATGTTSNLLMDGLGSVVALTDSTGVMQTEYTYDPFGRTSTAGVSNSNPFQYTARENDGTGLFYYRARYYDPRISRFISEDPIIRPMFVPNNCLAMPQGKLEWPIAGLLGSSGVLTDSTKITSPYLYAANNPVLHRDPTGLDKDKDCAGRAARSLAWCIGLTFMAIDIGETAIIVGCTISPVNTLICVTAGSVIFEIPLIAGALGCYRNYLNDLAKC